MVLLVSAPTPSTENLSAPRRRRPLARRRATRAERLHHAVTEALEPRVLLTATHLAFAIQPTDTTAGGGLSTVTVDVEDGGNAIVAGDTSLVTFSINTGPAGAPPLAFAVQAVNGVATLSGLSFTVAGNYTLHASDGTLTAANSNSFAINPDVATHLVITAGPTDTTAGATISSVTVAVEDQFDNVVTSDTSNVSLTIASGPGSPGFSGTTPVAAVAGVATFSDLSITKAGSYTFNVADGGLTGDTSGSFTVNPDTASQLVLTQGPSSTTAGLTLSTITADVEDQFGNVVTTDTSAVTVGVHTGSGTLAGTKTVNAVAGVATFSGLSITKADAYVLRLSDSSLATADTSSITISPDAATHLSITQGPTTTVAGQAISDIVVEVRDQYDNVVTTDTSNVTIALATGTGTLSGTKTVAASSGIATFSGLSMTVAGSKTFGISDTGLTGATTGSTTISTDTANHLAITTGPINTPAGQTLAGIVVKVEDQFNNIITTDSSNVVLSLATGTGTLNGTKTVAASNGVATFSTLSIDETGAFTLQAADGGLTVDVSGSFTITPALADHLVITAGPTDTVAGQTISTITVEVRDMFDNVVTTDSSNVVLALNTGAGSLSGTKTVAAVNGVATFSTLSMTVTGAKTFTVSDSGLTGATSGSFSITPAAASQLVITAQPTDTVAGQTISDVVAKVEDQYGNVVTTDSSNVTLAVNGFPGLLNGTATVAAVSGVATFSDLNITSARDFTLHASDGGLSSDSNSFTISPDAATSVVFDVAPSSSVAGNLNTVFVSVRDQYGNVVVSDSSTITIGIDSGSGALLGTTSLQANGGGAAVFDAIAIHQAGDYTLFIADGNLVGATSNSFTISAAAASQLVVTTQPTTTVAGQTISNVVAKVEDQYGNVVTTDTSNVTIGVATGTGSLSGTKTVAAVNGVATLTGLSMTTAGSKTFTVTDTGLTSATTNSISITAGTASQLLFTTNPASGTVGALGSVVVKVEDTYGNVVTTDSSEVDLALNGGGTLLGTASANAVSGIATFSGLSVHESGEYTLTATDTGLTDGNSSIFDLDPGTATKLAIDTQPVTTAAGNTLSAIVLVEDQYGNLVTSDNSQVTVALGSGSATIGGTKTIDVSNGAAIFSDLVITKAGDYTFHFSDGSLSTADSNQFSITPLGPGHLTISTGPTTTVAGQTITTIVVQVQDDYGNISTSDNASNVTISVNSGPGSLAGTTTETAANGIATFSDLDITTSGNYTLTVSDDVDGVFSDTSGTFSITPDIASKVVFTTAPASGTVGGLNTVVAKVEDQYNNVVTTNTSSVTLAIASGSGALLGTTSVNAVAGVATFNSLAIHTADSYTISAADTGLTGATSGSFSMSPDVASKLIITQQPTTTVAGQTISDIIVEVRDQYDNVVTTDSSNVTIALATGTGTLSGTKTVAASSGIATFSGLSMTAAGNKTFTITDSGLTSATTSSTTISPDSADHLSITAGPTTGSAGALNTITVAVEDQFNNIVTSDSSTVGIAMNSGGGTLLGTASVAAVNGVATFNALSIHTPGTFTLAATDGSLTTDVTGSFTISPAAASQTVFTTQPGNISAGALGTVVAKVEDAFGNVVTTDSSTVLLVMNSGGGTLMGTTSTAAVNGVATFNAVTIHTAGTFTLGASDTGITTGISNSFTVSPTAATHLAFTSQPSSMVAGNLLTGINVSIEDQYNNVVTSSNANITFNVTGGGSTFNFVIAAVNGVATLNSIFLVKAGSYGVKATSPGLTLAGSNIITVTPDVASQILITTEPTTTVAGQSISNIVVTVEDQFNNTVTTDSSSVTLAINSGSGALAGTKTLNATAGVATFSGLSITTTGAYTLSAADTGLTGDTSGSFNITPGTASKLAITTQPSDTVAGVTISNVVAKVEDQYGNVVTGDTSNVTIGVATGTGSLSGTKTVAAVAGVATFSTLSMTTTGSKTFTVTDSGLTAATTNGFAITPDVASKVVFTTQPASAAAGALNTVVAKVEDQYGNVVTTDTSEVDLAIASGSGSLLGTASANAVAGVATFSTLGIHTPDTYTLDATDGSLAGDTSSSFTITPAAASQLVITTQPTDTTAGQTISNTVVKVEDQWGNVVTSDTSAVTIAIATGSGTLVGTKTLNAVAGVATFSTLSITKTGAFTFNLTDSGLTSATTGSITIAPDTASKLVITAGPTNTVAGQTISSIIAKVEDQFSNVVTTDSSNVTIAIASGGNTLNGTKVVAAVNGVATFSTLNIQTVGSYTLGVTDGGLTTDTSGSFSITPDAATHVVITTQPAGAVVGGLNTVVVKVEDQFNNVVTTDTSAISLAVASGSGVLTGTTSVNAIAGVATFSALAIHTPDTYTLGATDTGLTGDTSSSFVVTTGPAAQLVFTQQPTGTTAGGLLSTIKVSVEDQYDNVVTTDSSNVNLTLNSGGNSVSLIVAAASGVASFSGIGLLHTGTFTFHAIDGSLTSANSTSFTIAPDVASQLVFTTAPAGGAAGTLSTIAVSVEDQFGNVVTTDSSAVTIALASGSGTLLGTQTVAAVNGVATFNALGMHTPGTFTVDVTDGGLASATSGSFTITPAAASQLVITTQPTTTVAGQTISNVVAKVEDQYGNIVTNDSSNVTIAIASGSGSLAGTKTVAAVNGVATFSTLSMNTAGNVTLDLADGVLSGATSNSFTINPDVASQLVITTQPTTTVAGQTISNIVAKIEDQFGNVITSDSSNVTIAIASGTGTLAGTKIVAASSGVATFSTLNITKTGSFTVAVSDGVLSAATSSSFSITPAAATHLAFTTQPSSGNAGALGTMAVSVEDQYNNVVTTDTSTVALAIASGSGSLLGTATLNAVAGVATFNALSIHAASTYTLSATDSGLTQDTSGSFTISPATASKLVITQQPTTTTAGQTISAVIAKVEDQYGNVETSDSSNVTIALTGTSGTLSGTKTVAAASGVATFSGLSMTQSGTYTLGVTDGGLSVDTSSSFAVTPDVANKLVFTTAPSDTAAGALGTVVVAVEDQFGNVVTSDTSTVTLAKASGPGTLIGTATVSAVAGVATFAGLNIHAAGSYTLSATDGGLTQGTTSSFAISPAAATKLVIGAQPANTVAGQNISTVVALVEDQYGNIVTSDASNVTIALASGTGPLGGTKTVQAIGGQAFFSGLSITNAGAYTLAVSDNSLTTDTSGSFNITPASAAKLVVTQQPTTTVAGQTISAIVAKVEDQYGNTVTTDASTVTIALASGNAVLGGNLTAIASNGVATFSTLSLTKSGSYTLDVTDAGLTGDTSGSFSITSDVANHLAVVTQPANALAGGNVTVVATVEDQYGNVVTNDTSSATIALASGPVTTLNGTKTVAAVAGVATFNTLNITKSGTYTLDLTDGILGGATSGSFTISPNIAAKLIITQQPGDAIAGQSISTVTAKVEDQYGNVVTGDSSTLSMGLINDAVVLHGTTSAVAEAGVATFNSLSINKTGTYTLHVTEAGLTSDTSASFNITPDVESTLVVNHPDTAIAGATLDPITVTAFDRFGNVVTNQTGSASLSGNIPSITGTLSENYVDGVATFGDLSITGTGVYSFTAADANLSTDVTNGVTITPAAPSQVAIQTQPTDTVAGQTISNIVVAVEDQYGNIVTNDSSSVAIAVSTGSGSLAGTQTVNAVNGIATFSGLSITTADDYTFDITDGSLDDPTTDSITISPAAPTKLVIQQEPGTQVGHSLSTMTVAVEDQYGNIVTSDSSNVTVAIATGSASLGGTLTEAPVNGIAEFDDLAITKNGTYTLSASDGTLTSDISDPFTIGAKLVFQKQPAATVAGVTLGASSFKVFIEDANGHILTNENSTISLAVTTGPGDLQGTVSLDAVNGVATFTDLSLDQSGTYKISASDDGFTDATSVAFAVAPAAPAQVVTLQDASSTVAGVKMGPAIRLQLQDTFGNAAVNNHAVITATIASGPNGATVGGTVKATVTNGIVTFSNLILTKAGTYTLQLAGAGLSFTTVSFNVVAAAAKKLAFIQQPTTAATNANLSPSVTVAVEDAFGNIINNSTASVTLAVQTGPTGSFTPITVNAVSGTATFNGVKFTKKGTYKLKASSLGLTLGASSAFAITLPIGGTH